jgi:COP9 signalosome complex subunit 12
VSSFRAAFKISGLDMSQDAVECLLANMIYKNYIRGYISHGLGILVLSKQAPFPSLLTRQEPMPL